MIRRTAALVPIFVVVLATGCSSGGNDPAAVQEKFGVRMAKMNLWREAMFRFQRAVEMNPQDAMAYNNLAVALEANGDFEGAAKAYREAMRLDKSNQYIQKNYSRFVEFTTRDRRRQQRRPAAQTAAAPAAAEAPAEVKPVEGEAAPAAPVEPAPVPETIPAPEDAPAQEPPPPAELPAQTNPPGGQS